MIRAGGLLLAAALSTLTLAACGGGGAADPEVPERALTQGTFPRIANCYGSALAWNPAAAQDPYLSKVQLFIGQGYDFHYDWDAAAMASRLDGLRAAATALQAAHPEAIVLSYVDVAEGPFTNALPASWWRRDGSGNKVSTWPGYYQLRTELPEVLAYNLSMVRGRLASQPFIDGVFFDVWTIDPMLVPGAASLRGGAFLTMVNTWNLADSGFDQVNGVLSEDELNRVVDGDASFADFLDRYLRWSRQSRKPALTTLVCHPRTIDQDPWRWAQLTEEQREAEIAAARDADPQMLRFGLATALLGDGYFAYDAGTMARGQWWWYPEFDAPLGVPAADATEDAGGRWSREFTGGRVYVNPTAEPFTVDLGVSMRDASTGERAASFTVAGMDGLIVTP